MLAQLNQQAMVWAVASMGVAWLVLLYLWFVQRKQLARMQATLRGAEGKDLQPLLLGHLESMTRMDAALARALERLDGHDVWMRRAISKTGLVRYDAFDDVGGHQSFALALQNDLGDGVLVTSLIGRQQVRVYGKLLNGGQCEQGLSPEEIVAIEHASRA
jgi:hypothetical protein